MARTINSPGVEIKEVDLSQNSTLQAGTGIFIPGFAAQGPTNELINITTKSELADVYFGGDGPTNAAERYFFHSCSEVLDSPGSLYTVRLPYGSDSGDGYSGGYVALAFTGTVTSGTGDTSGTSGTGDTNTMTISSAIPIHLTDDEYEAIEAGNLTWKDLSSPSPTSASDLGSSLFFIVNKMQSNVNDNYEGTYISITDQTPFADSMTSSGTPSASSVFDKFRYIESSTDGGVGTAADMPDNIFGVTTSGFESMLVDNMPINFTSADYPTGLVFTVTKMKKYATSPNPNLLYPSIVEQFATSVDKNAIQVNEITKVAESFYLEDVINKNSAYLKCFVNPKLSYTDNIPAKVEVDISGQNGYVVTLGEKSSCGETPTAVIGNTNAKLEKALTLIDNPLNLDIDVICDAGLSTIHAFSKVMATTGDEGYTFDDTAYVDPSSGDFEKLWSSDEYTESEWYSAHSTIYKTVNTFCSSTRKDCIYLSDPVRPIFVRGKDTKATSVKSTIFSLHVARALKNLYSSANSSYSAAYMNWVKKYDNWSAEYVWLPISGFVANLISKTDSNYYPWYAPAFLNRGILSSVIDIAIRPNQAHSDTFYKAGLNPVTFFSGDGFVVNGQKTLQAKASAFDRINVRRLFLTLERATLKAMRYFVGENNTVFTRTRALNVLAPLFDVPLNNEGLYDYRLVCDTSNNTPDVIDANEMHISAYLKPARTAEFIIVTFYATRTDANFDELIG